jgi:uncharacterized membrane protein YkvA (DUF1232 family)
MDTQNPKGENVAASAIFKKFLGKAEEYISKPTRLKQLLTDAYQKASDKKDVGSMAHEAWETMQTLFRLIRSSASGEYTGLPTPTIIAAVAVVIYFLSPIDLIPDFIPVLGLLDDVALVAWFSTTVKDEMDKFAEWERTHVSIVGAPDSHTATSSPSTSTSSAKFTNPGSSSPVAAAEATETKESGKLHGTTDLPPSDKQPSDTDSGISSPDSSNPNPSQTSSTDPAPQDVQPHTTDPNSPNILAGSRVPNSGPADNGGNIR